MTEMIEDTVYADDPVLLQVEETLGLFLCGQRTEADGVPYLSLGNMWFRSLPHVMFGLCLKPETTKEEAEALSRLLEKHCVALRGEFYDRNLPDEFYELNEHGLAKS